jgi:hypothetical protein
MSIHSSINAIFFPIVLLTLYIMGGVFSDLPPANSVSMKIVNKSGFPIDLFWINTFEVHRPLVRQVSKPIRDGTDTIINSFDTHEFLIKIFSPDADDNNNDNDVDSQATRVKKGSKDETMTIYFSKENKLEVIITTKQDEFRDNIRDAMEACKDLESVSFDECVAQEVTSHVEDLTLSIEEMKKFRNRMAEKLRNYTCADLNMETTPPLKSETLIFGAARRPVKVDTLLELSHSKVWVGHSFVTDDECEVLMRHGKPRLKRATIAAEDGTSIVSSTRKANQATYVFPSRNPASDPLWDLYNRIIDFINFKSDYDLRPAGQEEFAIIQYNPEDEYGSHCDADCSGETHVHHGRVATAVIYCKVPEIGGGTTFTKADVFVKPKKNDVTFFTYKGTDGKMDPGYTEHSGCPVVQGEKWITTAWLRQGVSAEDPWNDYDPSGIPIYYGDKKSEMEIQAN